MNLTGAKQYVSSFSSLQPGLLSVINFAHHQLEFCVVEVFLGLLCVFYYAAALWLLTRSVSLPFLNICQIIKITYEPGSPLKQIVSHFHISPCSPGFPLFLFSFLQPHDLYMSGALRIQCVCLRSGRPINLVLYSHLFIPSKPVTCHHVR